MTGKPMTGKPMTRLKPIMMTAAAIAALGATSLVRAQSKGADARPVRQGLQGPRIHGRRPMQKTSSTLWMRAGSTSKMRLTRAYHPQPQDFPYLVGAFPQPTRTLGRRFTTMNLPLDKNLEECYTISKEVTLLQEGKVDANQNSNYHSERCG